MAAHDLVTISNPSASLTDFTLIVDLENLTSSWWSAVTSSDGTKGRVYKGDGTTELAADWIAFDDTAKTGLLRVKWSGTLATSGTQQLWIEPPVSGNSSYAANDTYGSDNAYDSSWEGYWPLCEASGTIYDRTSNSRDGTVTGATYGATGRIGDGITFDGDADYINFGTGSLGITDDLTAMAWGYSTSDISMTAFGRHHADDYGWFIARNTKYDTIEFRISTTGSDWNGGDGNDNGYPINTWTHIVGTYDGSNMRAYVNGSAETEDFPASLSGNVNDNSEQLRAGARADDAGEFVGTLNELQLHSAARSAAWIAEEYAQTSDNSSFLTAVSWVAAAGGSLSIPVAMNSYRRQR